MNLKRTKGEWVASSNKSKRPRNALLGLAIGCAVGLASGAALDSSFSEDDEHLGKMIFTPIGCGAGAGVGAAIPGFETLYRAPNGAAHSKSDVRDQAKSGKPSKLESRNP
jgi:hypothetical protein